MEKRVTEDDKKEEGERVGERESMGRGVGERGFREEEGDKEEEEEEGDKEEV